MNYELNILGCGSAKPTLRHNPSCYVLNIRDSLYMIDCGEGAQKQMYRMGLKWQRLNNIFLTHLHGDHVLGLPGLLSTLSLMGKTGYITVYTFAKGIEWIKSEMEFFGGQLSYELKFKEINPEVEAVVYEDRGITVRTIPLNHRVPCVGYVFEEKQKPRHINKAMCDYHKVPISFMKNLQQGEDFQKPDGTIIPNAYLTKEPTPSKRYAHIGDTAYMPEIASKIGSVDLLYHETTYTREHATEAEKRGHSTAEQAAMIARDSTAHRLLAGHFSSRYKNEKVFLDEALPVFKNTILANEGLRISI
ncbi:MAG: ribonuclease Z [Prevotella sp.]|nr:ribonuclease Z [Prevotella sp.]MCM1074263.1 ribonuclease Z [Ruminococcus sp.]